MSYEIHEILSKVPVLRCEHVTSWTAMNQSTFADPLDLAKRKASDRLAHEAAGEVLRNSMFKTYNEPDGIHLVVNSYFLTYEQMLNLLTEVYSKGRTYERGHNLNFNYSP